MELELSSLPIEPDGAARAAAGPGSWVVRLFAATTRIKADTPWSYCVVVVEPVAVAPVQAHVLQRPFDKDGNPSIAKEVFTMESIVPRLREMAAADKDQVILVRGDRDVPYGKVMEVMGLVGQAGFTKVSLIAQSPGGAAPASPAAAPAGTAR